MNMKANKYLMGLVVALAGLTSCNTDVEGDYYSSDFANVSFDSKGTSVSLKNTESTATIPVRVTRAKTEGAYTATYTAEASAPGVFTESGNGTVSFADGEGSAIINVTANNVEKEVNYTYTLKLSDASVATADTITNNQISTYTISLFREGDWTEWKKWNSAGTGNFIYGGHFSGLSGDDPGLPFLYRQNIVSTNKYQLKIQHWGGNVDLVMDYDSNTGVVKIASESFTGFNSSTYGDIYVMDYNDWLVKYGGGSASADLNGSFDTEKGIIRIATIYIDYVDPTDPWGAGWESFYLDGFVRADYSITSLSFAGIFTDVSNNVFAVGNLELGPDATTVKAVVVPADADPEAVADAVAAGELEATDVTAGSIYVPVPEDMTGELQIVTVVLADDQVQTVSSTAFEYFGGGANPWKSLGVGYWTDDIVVPMFSQAGKSYTYQVEIQESTEQPGLYRVINAYAPVAKAFGKTGGETNIEINATDPSGVYILDQSIGLDFGYGAMSIETDAGYYVSKAGFDAVKAESPEVFGSVNDGVITFPVLQGESSSGNTIDYQIWLNMGGNSYFGGRHGEFKIVLPSAAGAKMAKAKAMAKASSFEMRLYGLNGNAQKVTKRINRNNLVKSAKKLVIK